MKDLITEARELATENISQPTVFYKDKSQRIMLRLCDALEKAQAEIERLRQHENTILIDHSHRFTEAGVRGLLEQIKTFNEVCLEHQQERLQREEEIRQLREAQRWIPVAERLPEDGNDVLVIASGKPQDNLNLDGAYEFASYLKNDGGWFFDAYPDWETPTITHWMPLPEPPAAEEGAEHE
jgi:hypothetical protein